MRGVRFTVRELAVVKDALGFSGWYANRNKAEVTAINSALAKLEKAEMPVRKGLPLAEAMGAFREVLGNRLVSPPSGAQGVYAQMTKRITALGLSRMDCVTIAKAAGVEWQGRIKAESLVRQADTLLSSAQMEVPGTQARGTPRTTAPVELGDDDI